MARFKDRNKIPRIVHTPFLSNASLYDDYHTAKYMADLVGNSFNTEVVKLTDKEIFKAKLTGQ